MSYSTGKKKPVSRPLFRSQSFTSGATNYSRSVKSSGNLLTPAGSGARNVSVTPSGITGTRITKTGTTRYELSADGGVKRYDVLSKGTEIRYDLNVTKGIPNYRDHIHSNGSDLGMGVPLSPQEMERYLDRRYSTGEDTIGIGTASSRSLRRSHSYTPTTASRFYSSNYPSR